MFSQRLSRLARPEGMPTLLVFLMLLFLFQDAARAAVGYTTPAAGSSERTIILDVVRRKVRELHEIDVVFVVEDLRVTKGWAWIRTRPQTADGTGRYEEFSALLKKTGKTYRIVAIPCTEPDNPDCLDSPGYFSRLKKRFPGLPPEILPQ